MSAVVFALAATFALALPVLTLVFLRRQGRGTSDGAMPASFSMLVPVRGVPDGFADNVASWLAQDLAGLDEIIVCVERDDDPLLVAIAPLVAGDRSRRLRVEVAGFDPSSLGKMNNLLYALSSSKGDGLLLVDADARFDAPDYLSRFVAPLGGSEVGLVTCHPAYRDARSVGAALIGLAINVDLLPRIAIRTLMGGQLATAIGTTLALRRDTIEALGGLEFLRRQLLMDTKLAEAVVRIGRRVVLHAQPVGVYARSLSVRDALAQANRWHLGIKGVVSRGVYVGYCLQRVVFGAAPIVAPLLDAAGATCAWACVGARLATALLSNRWLMRDPSFWRSALAIPFVDAVMALSALRAYVDNTFVWSGRLYELGPGAVAKPRSAP